MNKIKKLFLLGLVVFCSIVAQANSIVLCSNKQCNPSDPRNDVSPLLEQIKTLLQENPNGRLDFCEASPSNHQCTNNAIYWNMRTDTQPVRLAIPNARIHMMDKIIYLDYLISANHSFPRCMFSPLKLSVTPNNSIQIVSSAYNCNLMETEPTNIQKTLIVDFIDKDHHVVGGHYVIQGGGALQGQVAGYALMQFRESKRSLPLTARRHENNVPSIPGMEMPINNRMNIESPYEQDPFLEQQDWWDSVKETWRVMKETADVTPPEDRPQKNSTTNNSLISTDPPAEEHWWKDFSKTFMKILYFEPLDY